MKDKDKEKIEKLEDFCQHQPTCEKCVLLKETDVCNFDSFSGEDLKRVIKIIDELEGKEEAEENTEDEKPTLLSFVSTVYSVMDFCRTVNKEFYDMPKTKKLEYYTQWYEKKQKEPQVGDVYTAGIHGKIYIIGKDKNAIMFLEENGTLDYFDNMETVLRNIEKGRYIKVGHFDMGEIMQVIKNSMQPV